MHGKMKILIAYDGSECADAALDDLRRAGLPNKVEAFVISGTEIWLPPPPPSSYEIVEAAEEARTPAGLERDFWQNSPAADDARELALQARACLQQNFPEWSVSMESFVGSPAHEIIRKADEWQPDLIVVGSHGRSAIGRVMLGSVSQKVLTEARCSVRIARARLAVPESPVRLVLGIDGTPDSGTAVYDIASREWATDSAVLIVTAVQHFHKYGPEPKVQHDHVSEMQEAAGAKLREAGLLVSTLMKEGEPRKVLIEAAEEWGADCIFVGANGHRFIRRFLLGSTSWAVAARAVGTVEVARSVKPS